MDDTHTPEDCDAPRFEGAAAAEGLAALDPADAPDLAERLAAELAEDLETAGTPQTEPQQLAVEIENPAGPTML